MHGVTIKPTSMATCGASIRAMLRAICMAHYHDQHWPSWAMVSRITMCMVAMIAIVDHDSGPCILAEQIPEMERLFELRIIKSALIMALTVPGSMLPRVVNCWCVLGTDDTSLGGPGLVPP